MNARSPEMRMRAERDGCECPPWILRCAHFEGKAVALGYKRRWMAEHAPDCDLRLSITANMRLEEYGLYYPEGFVACVHCGAPAMGAIEPLHVDYFTDVADAIAAFEAAAVELMGHEVQP